MSFILDALKKSESERQQHGRAEFSAIPASSASPRASKWLWILAALLAVNGLVLAGILFRGDTPSLPEATVASGPVVIPPPATVDTTSPVQSARVESTFAAQVAAARDKQSVRNSQPDPVAEQPRPVVTAKASAPAAKTVYLRTFDEARVQGLFQMSDLHLDIHVYSEKPADRFVFINMVKHKELSRLDEGPTVNEITTDGVVLEYQGTRFLLPRD